MNYKKHYDLLIKKAIVRQKKSNLDFYTENHHIIPVCMGGNNSKENMVRLTAREHYIAHELLYKQYRSTKLAYAWICMSRNGQNQERNLTSKQYEKIRIIRSQVIGEALRKNPPFKGKTHSKETKKILSDNAKRWHKENPYSEERIKKFTETVAKMPKTDEHRKKIGRSGFIMMKNIHTGEVIRVERDSPLDADVWVNPYKYKIIKEGSGSATNAKTVWLNGIKYNTIKEAAKKENVSYQGLIDCMKRHGNDLTIKYMTVTNGKSNKFITDKCAVPDGWILGSVKSKRGQKIKKNCLWCDKEFTTVPSQDCKCCSRECSGHIKSKERTRNNNGRYC